MRCTDMLLQVSNHGLVQRTDSGLDLPSGWVAMLFGMGLCLRTRFGFLPFGGSQCVYVNKRCWVIFFLADCSSDPCSLSHGASQYFAVSVWDCPAARSLGV